MRSRENHTLVFGVNSGPDGSFSLDTLQILSFRERVLFGLFHHFCCPCQAEFASWLKWSRKQAWPLPILLSPFPATLYSKNCRGQFPTGLAKSRPGTCFMDSLQSTLQSKVYHSSLSLLAWIDVTHTQLSATLVWENRAHLVWKGNLFASPCKTCQQLSCTKPRRLWTGPFVKES